MGQCTHPDCIEQAAPGSNRCEMHAPEGSRSDKLSEPLELGDMGDASGGSGLGGLGTRGRAQTGGYGSIYGYMTQEFRARSSRAWILPVAVIVVAVIALVVMRMMSAPTGP